MRGKLNQRQKAKALLIFSVLFLGAVAVSGVFLRDAAMVTDFSRKNIPLEQTGLEEICFTERSPGFPPVF